MAELEYDVDEHVATITLTRPKQRNAFTRTMLGAWTDGLLRAEADDHVRVVVVTGAGSAFCAGADFSEIPVPGQTDPWEAKTMLTDSVHRVSHAMERMTKPVIAAVNGPAIGAGMDLALMCDIRLAPESALFAASYVRLGIVPGNGGCWWLPRIVGTSTAVELLLTGRAVEPLEAFALRLVSAVHPDQSLLLEAKKLAHTIAAFSPVAVRLIKRLVKEGANHGLTTALDLASSHLALTVATSVSAMEDRPRPRP